MRNCNDVIVAQEHFCFGEEITAEDNFTSFGKLPVKITRNSPACIETTINLTLFFEDNGTILGKFMQSSCHISLYRMQELLIVRSISADINEICTFQPLEMESLCTIDVQGKNRDFQNDTVLGVVSLGQKDTSFCKQQNKTTEKNVTIYRCKCRNGCSLEMFP